MAGSEQVMLLTTISKKLARKVKINRNRRLRRKRSKKFFLLKLKRARAKRTTDSFCDIVDLLGLHDKGMDFQVAQMHQQQDSFLHPSKKRECGSSFANSLQDVSEWHHHHQLAYWKSRAMSLHMENQVLHSHIKDLYGHQMQQYLACKEHYGKWEQVDAPHPHRLPQNKKSSEKIVEQHGDDEDESIDEVDESKLPPAEQPGEGRRAKMRELYGDEAAKINGMETAVQLNYEYYLKKYKPTYWPNIPLNL